MKKIIQILLIIILTSIIALIVVFVFNPFNLRTKLISSAVNSYLSNTLEDYTPLETTGNTSTGSTVDKNPLLNEEQEKTLESYGVDVSALPSSITPAMEACFIEKVGQERANEIVGGASPSAMEILKAKNCLGM